MCSCLKTQWDSVVAGLTVTQQKIFIALLLLLSIANIYNAAISGQRVTDARLYPSRRFSIQNTQPFPAFEMGVAAIGIDGIPQNINISRLHTVCSTSTDGIPQVRAPVDCSVHFTPYLTALSGVPLQLIAVTFDNVTLRQSQWTSLTVFLELADPQENLVLMLLPSRKTERPEPGDEMLRFPFGSSYSGSVQADIFHFISAPDNVRFRMSRNVGQPLNCTAVSCIELRMWPDYNCGVSDEVAGYQFSDALASVLAWISASATLLGVTFPPNIPGRHFRLANLSSCQSHVDDAKLRDTKTVPLLESNVNNV